MRACANAVIDRAQDLLAVVFEELLHPSGVNRLNIEVRGMMNMDHAARDSPAGPPSERAAERFRWPGRHDHFALVDLRHHIAWQAPRADGEGC